MTMLATRANGLLTPRFFSSLFDDVWPESYSELMKIDAKETDAAFEIRADVPGVNSENVRLHFEDHILKIEASRDGEHKEKGDNYYLQERNWGKQSRSIRFREGIKEDEITAKLENGVLLVTVPKEKPRKAVEIKVK